MVLRVSPFSTLPLEILAHIFALISSVVPNIRPLDSLPYPAWLPITYVCHYWCTVALSHAQLWTSITPGLSIPWIEVQPWTCHGLHESWQGRCRESFRIHGQPVSADVRDSCYFLGSADVSRSRRCFSNISLNSKSRRKLDKYMRCNDWNIINETIRAQGLANAHI